MCVSKAAVGINYMFSDVPFFIMHSKVNITMLIIAFSNYKDQRFCTLIIRMMHHVISIWNSSFDVSAFKCFLVLIT